MAFQAPAPPPGPMGAGPPGGNPDDLLMQIRDLLDQYLAMGADTPVAQEAQTLADAIDQTTGGGAGDMGAPPDAGAQPQVPPANQPGGADPNNAPPDPGVGGGLDSMLTGPEPPPSNSKTFAGANVNAMDRLKKKNKAQGKA